jgi:adenosylcobyric acid synthase
LNSYVTREGGEIGRAQVLQAYAAGLEPSVKMNPILLKPTTDQKAQVILFGKVHQNMSAAEYFDYKPNLKGAIKEVVDELDQQYDMMVIEGAGSPAEINLKEQDIVNMGMAEIADSPVILIGDIDKGGVFASLYGTVLLLTQEERKRVKGIIINKFRGDINILNPGIKQLEALMGIPVIGVIPYHYLQLDDEDGVTDKFKNSKKKGTIQIEVLKLPHISNFTDFDVFYQFEDVSVKYVMPGQAIGDPDILIIPGSKNTIDDLVYLYEQGYQHPISKLSQKGKMVFGICGGFQILGQKITDPHSIETERKEIKGLGLLDMETVLENNKVTEQVETIISEGTDFLSEIQGSTIKGYEIHCGTSHYHSSARIFLKNRAGVTNLQGNVMGTYLHGIFDNIIFTNDLLNKIRKIKGINEEESPFDPAAFREDQLNQLADLVRHNLDMEKLYQIINKID